jgi:hypothetical protein
MAAHKTGGASDCCGFIETLISCHRRKRPAEPQDSGESIRDRSTRPKYKSISSVSRAFEMEGKGLVARRVHSPPESDYFLGNSVRS